MSENLDKSHDGNTKRRNFFGEALREVLKPLAQVLDKKIKPMLEAWGFNGALTSPMATPQKDCVYPPFPPHK